VEPEGPRVHEIQTRVEQGRANGAEQTEVGELKKGNGVQHTKKVNSYTKNITK